MTRSTWDRILGLAWVIYGAAQLSNAAYLFIRLGIFRRVVTLPEAAAVSPFWAFLALLIAGGVAMVLGRRWAWVMMLVLSLLYSAFSALNVHAFLYIWTHFHPPIGEAARDILPIIAFWALTAWTVVRFFSRPLKTHAVAEQ